MTLTRVLAESMVAVRVEPVAMQPLVVAVVVVAVPVIFARVEPTWKVE